MYSKFCTVGEASTPKILIVVQITMEEALLECQNQLYMVYYDLRYHIIYPKNSSFPWGIPPHTPTYIPLPYYLLIYTSYITTLHVFYRHLGHHIRTYLPPSILCNYPPPPPPPIIILKETLLFTCIHQNYGHV